MAAAALFTPEQEMFAGTIRTKASAGDRGTALAGDEGEAHAGDHGMAVAGWRGRAQAGFHGLAIVGEQGIAIVGPYGTATVGEGGMGAAGVHGTLKLGYWHREQYQFLKLVAGQDVEPNVLYRVGDNHQPQAIGPVTQ